MDHQHTALEELLDALVAGVLLTSCDGRVLYMNQAAKRQVETGDVLCLVNQRLKPIDDVARASLMAAIAQQKNDAQSLLRSIALPGVSTGGLVASILPLSPNKTLTLQFEATAAVFLEAPVQQTHLPSEPFAKLYGLTDGELRMLISMSLSHSIEDAATRMRIKTCTAKTHLRRIYEKTGTTKLSELSLLFMHSVLRHALTEIVSDDEGVD